MSPPRSNAGSYRLVFTPQARERWQQLPSRERRSVDRTLARLAFMVGLRQWVNPVEAQEEFQVQVASSLVTYELDPSGRTLLVKSLEPHA